MLQVVWSMVHVRSTLYGFTDMGYFFSSSFLRACGTETESRPIKIQPPWSTKDLLYGKRTLFSCGKQRVIPSGLDSAILPARVVISSSCPLMELITSNYLPIIVLNKQNFANWWSLTTVRGLLLLTLTTQNLFHLLAHSDATSRLQDSVYASL